VPVPNPDTTNVLVGYARLYTAPAGTAMPAETVAFDGAWGSSWTYIGATEEGITQTIGTDTGTITIEESSIAVLTTVTAKTFTLGFALSEDTLESIKLAAGGGTITTTAAASAQIGKKVLTLSDTLDQLAVGFEAVNKFGFFRRVYVPTVLSTGTVATPYRRAANNRAYPVELHATCRPDQIQIVDKTAAALP
jgi:hypothetical protein